MILLENITKKFNDKIVLDRINMNMQSGEALALIGPSGTGKTTLIRVINGFVKPDQGKVFVAGKEVNYKSQKDLRRIRKRIGMIYQLFNLVDRMSALENVLTGALGRFDNGIGLIASTLGFFGKREKEKAMELLKFVGIEHKAHERVDRLSGGEKQRVAIARALMQDPDILLADEPIANLDPKTSKKIVDLLLRINAEKKITLICVLHNVNVVRDNFKRVVALKNGKVYFDGSVDQLTHEHIHDIYGFEELEQDIESVEYKRCLAL